MTPPETPPNPLPSDRLFETGCCFCGVADEWAIELPPGCAAVTEYHFPTGVLVHTRCASRLGGWGCATPEYTRRKSLSSPPSPAEGEPQPGELWLVRRPHGQIETTATVRSAVDPIDGCPVWLLENCEDHNGRHVSSAVWLGGKEHASFWSLIRRATPPEGKEACAHRNTNLIADRCNDCGMTGKQIVLARVAKKIADPYTTRPHGMNEEQVTALMQNRGLGQALPRPPNAHDLRVAAMKEQWTKEFERKVEPRHPSDWDVFSTPGWES